MKTLNISDELHQQLRVKAVNSLKTIQETVEGLLYDSLYPNKNTTPKGNK